VPVRSVKLPSDVSGSAAVNRSSEKSRLSVGMPKKSDRSVSEPTSEVYTLANKKLMVSLKLTGAGTPRLTTTLLVVPGLSVPRSNVDADASVAPNASAPATSHIMIRFMTLSSFFLSTRSPDFAPKSC